MSLTTTPQAQRNAKQLRQKMTEAEKLLWSRIRNRQLGVKFRRQTPISRYIADFYCHEHKLIIELDGSQHLEQAEYDQIRTDYFNAQGISVLRFWNHEVMFQLDDVLAMIKKALTSTT
jgi:very-short-patch-repair endonuclease